MVGRFRGVIRRLVGRLGEKIMESPSVPYGMKERIVEHLILRYKEMGEGNMNSIDTMGYILTKSFGTINMGVCEEEWQGVRYRVKEERRLEGGSIFTVCLPDIKFPYSARGDSESVEVQDERYDFNSGIGSVFNALLFQSDLFKHLASYKRPKLSDFSDSGEKKLLEDITDGTRVPIFRAGDLAKVNLTSRSIIGVYQEHRDSVETFLDNLRDGGVRSEFVGLGGGISRFQEFMRKYGLDLNISSSVLNEVHEEHRGVPYSLYSLSENYQQNEPLHVGFVHGIQFPNFREDESLSIEERFHVSGALKTLFDYALYSQPIFELKNGTCVRSYIPKLVDYGLEEVLITRAPIPSGVVVPMVFPVSKGEDYPREAAQKVVDAYLYHKDQIDIVVDKLREGETCKELAESYPRTNYLVKIGAEFMTEILQRDR
jgi:hypothetical protein